MHAFVLLRRYVNIHFGLLNMHLPFHVTTYTVCLVHQLHALLEGL